MPATDSELTSMDDPCALKEEEGSSTNIPFSDPPPIVPSSTFDPTFMRPNLPSETTIEEKAVSMASNDCSSALSSPAEASPAKPAATSPTTFEGTVETNPATSHIAWASHSLTCAKSSLVNLSESPPLSVLPPTTFGSSDPEQVFPPVLTFKGVSVTLENNSVWKQFNSCGTEMILTKQGRRMFPYCRYRLAGLDPDRQYSLVLSIAPTAQYRYRWSTSKWEITGPTENQAQPLIRAFSHHYSPSRGSEWMGSLVSFYKLKLTNCSQDQEGHIILHSLHRYIPRLHVIPVPDGGVPTRDKPVVMGPESMTFTFPQTEFMAVTTYQNFRITQLKINHNPFAKGFRDDGNNPRLNRVTTEAQPLVKMEDHLVTTVAQPLVKMEDHLVTTVAQTLVKMEDHLVTTVAQPLVKMDNHLVTTVTQPLVKMDDHLVRTVAQPLVKMKAHLVRTQAQPLVKMKADLVSTVAQHLVKMNAHLVRTQAKPLVKMNAPLVTTEAQPVVKIEPHLVTTGAQPVVKIEPHLVTTEAQPVVKIEPHLVTTEAQPVVKMEPHLVTTKAQPVVKMEAPLVTTEAQPVVKIEPHLVTTEAQPVVKMEAPLVTTEAQPVVKMEAPLVTTEAQPVVKMEAPLVTTEAQPVVKMEAPLVTTEAQPVVKMEAPLVTTEAQPVVKMEDHPENTEAQPLVRIEDHLVTIEAQPLVRIEDHPEDTEARPVVKMETQPVILKPAAELTENKEDVVDLSSKDPTVPEPVSNELETTRLVLKPIMSYPSRKDERYVPCIRGKHALGELVLFQRRRVLKPKEDPHVVGLTPEVLRVKPKAISTTPASTPGSSPGNRKRRKRMNNRWANSRGRELKAAAASPTVFHSPSLTVAMQPELDDVEGLLFVSFTSKEALEVHVRDKPANSTPSASPVSLTTQKKWKKKADAIPATDTEKIARTEAILLRDLELLKHRQAIHPVLQEVGLKLSSLDPMKSVDLQYLGVHLPLPPPNLNQPCKAMAPSPADEGLSFTSRTGKTSDITKIKGWKNKFIRSKETSPSKCDGSQKNLSAFCSNMLDEYLESEAQYISERAAAFSTNSEGSVAYQLPVKSSSYVKTLDSVLKHRQAASKFPTGANRPCPLSHKPLLYSALAAPPPPLTRAASPVRAEARPIQPAKSLRTQPVAPRLSAPQPAVSQRPTMSFVQSHGIHKPGFTKFQLKLLQMELGAQNQGLCRTQLTPERLSVALSVILCKQMQSKQVSKATPCPKFRSVGPVCGKEFCTLGCVCSSLQHLNRGPLHCRRPECMFGCACFKRKITKQATEGEREEPLQPVYSMTNMEHVVQPGPGSHTNKLWNHNTHAVDPEPIFTPKCPPPWFAPVKVLKRSTVPRTNQPIREEDKDPVYKYLESMMTCARVRAFNSKPPLVLTEPKVLDTSTPNTAAHTQATTTDDQPTNCLKTRPTTTEKAAEKASRETASDETEAKKQIEIQSSCKWAKDRRMVLKALFQRMNQNRLSRGFWVGPFRIRPIAKIFMRKPSGSILTYRVCISKPSKASDVDEDEYEDSDEEKHTDESFDAGEDDDGQNEESEMRFGVTPFLSGVLPAGRLRARTKPVGCQEYGLIQVNGKSYNQARLLLGNMGSLHPANRLAAFVTGRLHPPGGTSLKNCQKSDPTNKTPALGALHIKAAGSVVPPIITARKTTDLKTHAQPPAQQFPPDSWKKGSINLPPLQNSSTANPFVSGQRSSFQNSSTSSPVSLTVSPSLKTPSFLAQSGTYSFRICPPANQPTTGENLPGVTLPGGFTLIQLPKPGADGAASESENTTNTAAVDKARSQKEALFNLFKGGGSHANLSCLDAFTGAKDLLRSRLVEAGPSSELKCDEKTPSEERDKIYIRHVETASEDSSSDSSDYCGEADEHGSDEEVDIETVEEARQGMAIAQMKKAFHKALKESGDSMNGFGLAKKPVQDKSDGDQDDKKKRSNHTVLERQRRSEQRVLFDKLQTVLKSDPRAPRLRLLSLAQKEIKHLSETSKLLAEKKRMLYRMQALYIKELSVLSGKSDILIKDKVKEICERQKIREKKPEWKPFFSNLLQSRAAVLQATTSNAKLQPTPPLQPNLHRAPSQANPLQTAAQKRIMSLLQPNLQRAPAKSSLQNVIPRRVYSLAKGEVASPSLQGGPKIIHAIQEIPGVPAQVSTPNSQMEGSVAVQDGASPTSPKAKSDTPPVEPQKPFALPLVRSKTGRIILPSSLKPLGYGFYTLTVMQPKEKGEEDEVSSSANTQPSDMDSSTNQDKSASELDRPLDLGSSHISEEDKTVQPSNSKPNCSGATPPLTELALLNKSIFVPSVNLKAVESGQEGVKTRPTAVEPDPSPPAVRRGRGRPRKHPVTPVGANEKHAIVEDTSKSESETSILFEEAQSEKTTLECSESRAEDSPGVVSDNPVPVKRGRGRPPKRKSAQLWSPPNVRAGRSPSASNEDSPVRRSSFRFKSPEESPATTAGHGDGSAYRPLTRGAMGKDFPSAKKRSWIDVEKELEPELESE